MQALLGVGASALVEHVGLWAMEQAGLEELLEGLGFNGRQRAVAMAFGTARVGTGDLAVVVPTQRPA